MISGAFFTVVIISCMTLNFLLESNIFKASMGDLYAIEQWKPVDNTKIFDSSGNVISEQFNEYHIYLPLSKIPKKMIDAIIAIEDRKFWRHKGIDIFAILRAGFFYLGDEKSRIKQGASTITQQVIKNLILSREKTLGRKIREIVLALYLETFVSKEKILEIYCNSIFLGHGAYGVGAAAKRYFNKDIKDLDVHESSLIAGLFQSPGKYNPMKYPKRAKKRQLQVLLSLKEAKLISEVIYQKYKDKKLTYAHYKSQYGKVAPYFVDYVMEEAHRILEQENLELKGSGLKIYTTLDRDLDRYAEDAFRSSSDIFRKLDESIIYDNKGKKEDRIEKAQGAMIVLDRKTGEILSMIGGRNYAESQFNRAIHALRAPGSVFKTFIYTLGLFQGRDWNKLYYVAPITVGNYRPRTSYSQLFSETTMLQSFYKSINSTTVLLGQEIGLNKVINFVKKLGVSSDIKREASTFLGGSDTTMLDMARAYLTIANQGFRLPTSVIKKIVDRKGSVVFERDKIAYENKRRILNKASYELIKEGLKTVVTHGTGYRARHLAGKIAGKTGTSNKAKDNWFCGFTKDLVIVTWMGSDQQNSFKGHISASNTATVLWARFAAKALGHLKSGYLKPGLEVSSAEVHPRFGHLDSSGIRMFFLSDRIPKEKESDLLKLENGKKLRLGMNDF